MNTLKILGTTIVFILVASCRQHTGSTEARVSIDSSKMIKGIQLVPLYKTQLEVFAKIRLDSSNEEAIILNDLYRPNRSLLSDCFGYTDSSYVLAQQTIYRNRMPEVEAARLYFDSIDFDALLQEYEKSFVAKTGQEVSGKFYFSFFDRRICNFCGCDKETMQMDLLVAENQDRKFLEILLPHEINHNAFETSQNDTLMQETVLYKAIDEGFANLVSQKLAEVAVNESFGLTDAEFRWYTEHEDEIKQKVKPILFSEREEDWDPLGIKLEDSFMEGSPGNIGYYVGYRIVEEFLKKKGKENWKLVYHTPVKDIYTESGW